MNKFIDWFRSHDPFDGNVPQLRSLVSGLASSEGHGINCDETETIGSEIQRSLDRVSVRNATIKRRQMVHTLNELKPGVKVDEQTVQIYPSILFLRCTALAQRENEDITAYVAHEMTAVPTSLFGDFFMRKVDKSELGREIKKNVRNIMPDYATQLPPDSMPVIDGGWLLHFTRWKKNATYADVLGQYSSFLRTNYGMCCLLFDGYEYDSTIDHEHKRHETGKLSASIVIAENAQVHIDQQAFFSNEKNKTNFISLLTTHPRGIGHQVEVSCVMQIHSLYPVRLNSLGMFRTSQLWQKTRTC